MSGPPGTSILNRGPYNGLPSVGGAPPRGIDGELPSGKVTAGFRNDVIEPMANATATHPFFIAPMQTNNTIYENDILMIKTSGESSKFSNLGSDYGVYAKPLRLLNQDSDFWDKTQAKTYDTEKEASDAAKTWRCVGIVVAVGAGHDNDRQLVNCAIRGRIGAPNIWERSTKVKDVSKPVSRGDLFCVTISVVKINSTPSNSTKYKLKVGTAAIKSVSDLPDKAQDVEKVIYYVLGTYIRQLSRTGATRNTIVNYLLGDKSILDRKATYEIALRL